MRLVDLCMKRSGPHAKMSASILSESDVSSASEPEFKEQKNSSDSREKMFSRETSSGLHTMHVQTHVPAPEPLSVDNYVD